MVLDLDFGFPFGLIVLVQLNHCHGNEANSVHLTCPTHKFFVNDAKLVLILSCSCRPQLIIVTKTYVGD